MVDTGGEHGRRWRVKGGREVIEEQLRDLYEIARLDKQVNADSIELEDSRPVEDTDPESKPELPLARDD